MDNSLRSYRCLPVLEYILGDYSITPIRYIDRLAVLKWRNEQMYHLRQAKPLTVAEQEHYFTTIIPKLFEQRQPNQILFSFLKNGKCIGYGGLVHINWIDKHAEISFIMNTELESVEFDLNWTRFLRQIETVAFEELNFHKLFVYAFDIRPHLYLMLMKNNYFLDATLKEHCFFNNKYIDVVIHSKISNL